MAIFSASSTKGRRIFLLPGITCEYRSSVIPTLLWPSRSLATFGMHPRCRRGLHELDAFMAAWVASLPQDQRQAFGDVNLRIFYRRNTPRYFASIYISSFAETLKWAVVCTEVRSSPDNGHPNLVARCLPRRDIGNSHRTLARRLLPDCLLSANWPNGPIFDPLRPDLKETLRSTTPRFWTLHATSPHEVLNEEADPINRFRHVHCYALINRDTNCAGEAKMQCRDAIKSARVLVLASD
jgi:hypothetical protein